MSLELDRAPINQQINSNTEFNLQLDMTWSNPNSVSRIHVVLESREKGKITLELVRHLSPITFSKIIKGLPFSGRLHFMDHKLGYVETGLTVGAEKQKSTFQRGDLGFMISNGSICIILQDTKGLSMNHIGHCIDDPLMLESIESGEIIFIKLASG
ncbi:MAG TPA: cyclophilin-like family protein [Nitrososphaeraceae archaeon]|jgi:hypothetical protein|nr:cyclophilin-like family protein [Nitrososphaeraceae archaeon]